MCDELLTDDRVQIISLGRVEQLERELDARSCFKTDGLYIRQRLINLRFDIVAREMTGDWSRPSCPETNSKPP